MSDALSLETRCCRHCQKDLPLSAYRPSGYKGGYKTVCRDCQNKRKSYLGKNKVRRAAAVAVLEKVKPVKEVTIPSELQDYLQQNYSLLAKLARQMHYSVLRDSLLYTWKDILAEGFIKMYTATRYPPIDEQQVGKWANVIFLNCCNMCHRTEKSLRKYGEGYMQEQYMYSLPDSYEEVSVLVPAAIEKLSPKLRDVVLAYGEGLTGKQIAESLSLNPNTVKVRYHDACIRLRKILLPN